MNGILTIISASSLTDEEWATVEISTQTYSLAVYNVLLTIIDDRESVSNTRDRLRYLFLAHGTEVEESSAGKSNILVGGVLC